MKKRIVKKFSLVFCLLFIFQILVTPDSIGVVGAIQTDEEQTVMLQSDFDESIFNEHETILVYLWTKDIDHESIKEEVVSRIGSIPDINSAPGTISDELFEKLIANSRKESTEGAEEFRAYLKRTLPSRMAEQRYADEYISLKRSLERQAYETHNDAFLREMGIENKAVFVSQYSPMMICEINKADYRKIVQSGTIESITLYRELEAEVCATTLTDLLYFTRTDVLHDTYAVSGNGVKIGVVDVSNNVTSHNEMPASRFHKVSPLDNSSDHFISVSRITAGTNGIANEAEVYLASVEGHKTTYNLNADVAYYSAVESLISNNVSVINSSFGFQKNNESYSNVDKWADHISYQHSISFVVAVGNKAQLGYRILAPGMGYNVITVGGFLDNNTSDTDDDIIYSGSNYLTLNGCQKPDFIANAKVWSTTGTSLSAPIVTGTIALLFQIRPVLKLYPQIVKAILSSSCHYKVKLTANGTPESMTAGLSDRQGAGVVSPYIAVALTSHGNYGIRKIDSLNDDIDVRMTQPFYGASGMNVSIAWMKNTYFSNSNTNHLSPSGLLTNAIENLDLCLYRGNSLVDFSYFSNSSVEMIYYDEVNQSGNTFDINIYAGSSLSTDVYVGYAWSISTERVQFSGYCGSSPNGVTEGIYSLKNKGRASRLRCESDGDLGLSSAQVSGLKWIAQIELSGAYVLTSEVGTYGNLCLGRASSSGYQVVMSANGNDSLQFELNNDGSYSIKKSAGALKYYLTAPASGSTMTWQTASSPNDYQRWYFEEFAYQKGDVDMYGEITSADAGVCLDFAVETDTPTALEAFLADVDGDGYLTAADARLALRYAVDLE